MHLLDSFQTVVAYVIGFLTLSPNDTLDSGLQVPLVPIPDRPVQGLAPGPVFKPPGGDPKSNFTCDYSAMLGVTTCFNTSDQSCWLYNSSSGDKWNTSVDYESDHWTPKGITRNYVLNLKDDNINADGLNFTLAKIFDGKYPGPLIEACWGDTVQITVNNLLQYNGTSMHWHGIRQFNTFYSDGVNGLSQCPIAPGDSYNYTWRVMQYGSSWYHSHYSVQYADGAAGPITLHGPSSGPYDAAVEPILMTDWGHNSAFQAVTEGLEHQSILLNGIGNVTNYDNSVVAGVHNISQPYTITFDATPVNGRPRRYLLRLINVSFSTTFIFSIDGHNLIVVGADFVPITGYPDTSVLVGIGQRYHVIVEANDPDATANGLYWINTWVANCLFLPNPPGPTYQRTGILRYNNSTAVPNTKSQKPSLNCADENYSNLVPVVPWTVQLPANDAYHVGQNFSVNEGPGDGHPFPLANWAMNDSDPFPALQINYSDPIFQYFNESSKAFNPLYQVYLENYTDADWVWFVILGDDPHPIHLHGHDFAILTQSYQPFNPATFHQKLLLNNPPRRDVILLPRGGYVVIAFPTDNPGSWLMHCHIAFHAAGGLAVQILERPADAGVRWPAGSPEFDQSVAGCTRWNAWYEKCKTWPGDGSRCWPHYEDVFPDSGI